MGANKTNESKAANIKQTVGDEVAWSNEIELEAPEREGSEATDTRVDDKHGATDVDKADNLHGMHAASGEYEWHQNKVGRNPEDMPGEDECPSAGDHKAMEGDWLKMQECMGLAET